MANKKWRVKKTIVCRNCNREIEVRQPSIRTDVCDLCQRDYYRRLRSKLFGRAWKDIYDALSKKRISRIIQFADALEALIEEVS